MAHTSFAPWWTTFELSLEIVRQGGPTGRLSNQAPVVYCSWSSVEGDCERSVSRSSCLPAIDNLCRFTADEFAVISVQALCSTGWTQMKVRPRSLAMFTSAGDESSTPLPPRS